MMSDPTPERMPHPLRSQPSAPVEGGTPEPQSPTPVIFIAGSSFSGSTLMGLMLGSRPEVVFAGELKDYKRRMQKEAAGSEIFCSCGGSRGTCPFWSTVQDRYRSETHLNRAPGFSWPNVVLGFKTLTGIGLRSRRETPHGALVRAVHEEARARNTDVTYVVDSSKSLKNLDAISRSPGVEPYVIHLIRDGMAVAASYRKRGFSTLYGVASWSIGNIFLRLYLRQRGLRSLRVDYRLLCLGDESTYRALNECLGLDLKPETVTADIRGTRYHIVSGNGKVRRSASDFQGIRYSETPPDSTAGQRLFSALVVKPLNRWFGIQPGPSRA